MWFLLFLCIGFCVGWVALAVKSLCLLPYLVACTLGPPPCVSFVHVARSSDRYPVFCNLDLPCKSGEPFLKGRGGGYERDQVKTFPR